MITTQISLIALPEIAWKQKEQIGGSVIDIEEFSTDALAIERRIAKGVNLENERGRYNLCSSRIEDAVKNPAVTIVRDEIGFHQALAEGKLPAITLGQEYLNDLDVLLQSKSPDVEYARLEASFHPPELLLAHARGFFKMAKECQIQSHVSIQARVDFIHWASNAKCGVIETIDPYVWAESRLVPIEKEIVKVPSSKLESINVIDLGESEDLDEEDVVDNTGRSAYLILREQVMKAIDHARGGLSAEVNFSNQPHEIITEVLNEFITTGNSLASKPTYIQVVYTDGSRGRPFPLMCIPTREGEDAHYFQGATPFRIALLSMRHLALDHDVDMAWFRNREVSKARAFGETDEFCYKQTIQQLQESRQEGSLLIHMYQTGLQPAVLGFYRAVIEEMLEREGNNNHLMVVPFYFRRSGRYVEGKHWG
ncbi:MAG: hypothetical protein D9V45_01840 [Chloroflexi bacterium]|nr:MAG: hypothetical protein D9V45_01840 [Chloroflexota bacterium]